MRDLVELLLPHKSSFPLLVEFCRKVRIMNKIIAFSRINFNFLANDRAIVNFNAITASQDVFPIQSFCNNAVCKVNQQKSQ